MHRAHHKRPPTAELRLPAPVRRVPGKPAPFEASRPCSVRTTTCQAKIGKAKIDRAKIEESELFFVPQSCSYARPRSSTICGTEDECSSSELNSTRTLGACQ